MNTQPPSIIEIAAVVGSQARALYEANRQLSRDTLPTWGRATYTERDRYVKATQSLLDALRTFGGK